MIYLLLLYFYMVGLRIREPRAFLAHARHKLCTTELHPQLNDLKEQEFLINIDDCLTCSRCTLEVNCSCSYFLL
jgi:hypothetical protein